MKTGWHGVLATTLENLHQDSAALFYAGRPAILAAHAGSQVVGADEDRVDAGYRENLIGVAHGLDVLTLQNHQDLVIGAGIIVDGRGREIERVDATPDTAVPRRRILGRSDGGQRLLAAIDHRHHDAVSAVIQNPFDVVVAVGADP